MRFTGSYQLTSGSSERKRYDDGGYTGGNLDRPALKSLTADIESGEVDCVVVYKVDRISRSLMDFAKLLELFERKKVSFVSVTQQLNTSNPMGRLVLASLDCLPDFSNVTDGRPVFDSVRLQHWARSVEGKNLWRVNSDASW